MDKKDIHSSSASEDDEVDEIEIRKQNVKVQRPSVSAECFGQFNKKSDFKPRIIKKSEQTKEQINNRLSQVFMFKVLDSKEKDIVIDAMEEKSFKAGEWVIQQGEEGDVLYVVDSGELDCFKKYSGKPEPVFLKTYVPGESFGELALLYNAPRAASIKAKNDCKLFALDRPTFNHIVKDSSMRKRQKYDEFVKNWSLLSTLTDDYDKVKIVDSFTSKTFKQNEKIIQQGENENQIYILISGKAVAQDKQNQTIFQYTQKGDYFGEIPYIFKKPQPFNFIAAEESEFITVPGSSYKSTLKQVESQLLKNAEKYKQYL